MALINFPQAPTVSSIYAPKDSVAQLNYMNQSNVQGLSNLLNLGSKIHDYALSREQANLMEQPGGNEDQKMREIASIESRKINASDPSMIWRWKTQMDQQAAEAEKNRQATQNANAALKAGDEQAWKNKLAVLSRRDVNDSQGAYQDILLQLDQLEIEGLNKGYDLTQLNNLRTRIKNSKKGEPSGEFGSGTASENLNANVTDFLNKNPSSSEIEEFKKNNPNLTDDQILKLNSSLKEAKKREASEKYSKDLRAFAKSKNVDYDKAGELVKKQIKREFDAKRKNGGK
jgi:hypothetical protein